MPSSAPSASRCSTASTARSRSTATAPPACASPASWRRSTWRCRSASPTDRDRQPAVVEITKWLWPLLRPDNLLALALVLAAALLWTRWARAGRWLASFCGLLVLAILLLPIGGWLGQPLKQRFPPPRMLPDVVEGIVVLGGSIRSGSRPDRPDSLASISQRLVAFVELARRYPTAR